MKSRIPHIVSFAFAMAVSVPTIQALSISDVDAAGPGSTLSESRAPGRRVHKAQAAKKAAPKTTAKKKTTTTTSQATGQPARTTTTRSSSPATTRAQPQGPARATGRTRPAGSTARSTTTRRTTTSRPVSTRRTTRHVSPRTRHVSSRTEVHHHYYEEDTRQVSTARRVEYDDSPSTIEGYFTLGLGMSGFAAGQIVDGALSGFEYNLGLGAKGTLFGGELGFHGGAYTLGAEEGESSEIDFSVFGLSFDLKLQPSFSFFEPYLLAGVGGYVFQDGVVQESAGGGAVRLGFGADFRFDNFAISARYLFTGYALSNTSLYHNLNAQTESIGLNASFYF